MAAELKGRTIAILAADGVEQVELEQPRDAVVQAGAKTVVLSLDEGEIQAGHGPWTLVDAGLVKGRTLTSYPSLATDIENAGGPGSTRRSTSATAAR